MSRGTLTKIIIGGVVIAAVFCLLGIWLGSTGRLTIGADVTGQPKTAIQTSNPATSSMIQGMQDGTIPVLPPPLPVDPIPPNIPVPITKTPCDEYRQAMNDDAKDGTTSFLGMKVDIDAAQKAGDSAAEEMKKSIKLNPLYWALPNRVNEMIAQAWVGGAVSNVKDQALDKVKDSAKTMLNNLPKDKYDACLKDNPSQAGVSNSARSLAGNKWDFDIKPSSKLSDVEAVVKIAFAAGDGSVSIGRMPQGKEEGKEGGGASLGAAVSYQSKVGLVSVKYQSNTLEASWSLFKEF